VRQLFAFLLLLTTTAPLHAFDDDDIDGVANAYDLCPNTSFEDTVDENGCPENQHYWGKVTMTLGSNINYDDVTTTDYTFFANYNYHAWDFSLYSSQQGTLDSNNNQRQSSGDLYFSTGYEITNEHLLTKLTVGTKLATGSPEVSTGEDDYFTTLSFNYLLNQNVALLSSLSYTLTGKSGETTYANPFGYSFGLGYMINDKWYSSINYQNSNSIYEDSENYEALSFFNSYNFTDTFFATLNYARGLDELSYRDSFSLRLGVTFE